MLIKLLMLCMMLGGAFFWGYCTGHQPGSPDIYGIARDNCQKLGDDFAKLKEAGEKALAANGQAKGITQAGQGGTGGQDGAASPAPRKKGEPQNIEQGTAER
jgi:hypothetical protein